jgi:hypothetical protein
MNDAIRVQRYVEHFVGRLTCFELFERQQEQRLLDFEVHQVRRHIQAHEAGMDFFASVELSEIRRVVSHEDEAFLDRTADDPPIPARSHPEPSDMRRFVKAPSPRDERKLGAQAFVYEEFHDARGKSRSSILSDDAGSSFRQSGVRRGRPRRG